MAPILFVTGTDTGVGKTLLTALLLLTLRQRGVRALATKPFCSGGLQDVHILAQAQEHEISADRINPYYFKAPLAPLLGARRAGQTIALPDVVGKIRALAEQCDLLLVEGAGGLFVPLGNRYLVSDLIAALGCPVLLVARNVLGAVNHCLLSLQALQALSLPSVRIVLMDPARKDLASRSNARLLQELVAPTEVFRLPFLGENASALTCLKKSAKKLQITLARIVGSAILTTAFQSDQRKSRGKKSLAPSALVG